MMPRALALAAFITLFSTSSVSARDIAPPRYYFMLFAGQSVPFIPRTAHTWAAYVQATPTGAGSVMLEVFTISWLPVGGDVRIRNLLPVEGKNYNLEETFQIMMNHRAQMSMWGPYEIDADRFNLALCQIARLEGGCVRYRVIDSFRLKPSICHCVHAVTYADPILKCKIQPVLRVGEPGTSKLAKLYLCAGAFVDPHHTHDWLIPALGLDRYPVHRRSPGEAIPRNWL